MSTFDLFTTFVHLDSRDGAHPVPVTDTFWPELMAGERVYDGRMITASHISGDVDHWERHPAGGEVLILLSGAVDVVLDQPEGERRVPLDAGQAFIVPQGVWHRIVMRKPGDLVFITPGEGTDHRAL